MAKTPQFYVYRILGEMGETVYIGKGTGRRLDKQKRRFNADGEIIERFSTERLSYLAEKRMIAEYNPPLNRCGGGGGGVYGKPNPVKVTESHVWEVAARSVIALLSKQRKLTSFDMVPALKGFLNYLIEKHGEDEFVKRILPYGIDVKFEGTTLVTAI